MLMKDEGKGFIYFPILNFADGNLEFLHPLQHDTDTVNSLSDGAEIHLNKLTFDEFESMLPQAKLQIVRRRPSEELVRLLPALERVPKIRNFMTGTVFYVLKASA